MSGTHPIHRRLLAEDLTRLRRSDEHRRYAAAQRRGQGIALFREEVAKGMSKAAEEMKGVGLDVSVILFSMWTDSLKHVAEAGKGNMIFLDGSTDSMNRTMKQMMGLIQKDKSLM